jgi:hypothetical protein
LLRILKFLLLVLFALLIPWSAAAQSVQEKDGKVTGPGFVITLPPGIAVDLATASPESEHGFFLALPLTSSDAPVPSTPTRTYRYIAFQTRWDLSDLPSLDAVVQAITSNIVAYVPSDIVNYGDILLAGNFPARLGTLPARRLILKFKNNQHKLAIRQMIIAYNARKDAGAIVYFLVLNTTDQSFDDDIDIFGKILAGFKVNSQ